MSRELFYRQCRLRKTTECGYLEQVSYLPEPYCAVGRQLKLRTEGGNWIEGWVVMSAGEKRSAHHVEARERDYLKTRKASDI